MFDLDAMAEVEARLRDIQGLPRQEHDREPQAQAAPRRCPFGHDASQKVPA